MVRKLLVGLLVCLVVTAVVGAMMPAQWKARRSTSVAAPAAVVFPMIEDLRRWPEWTSWSDATDPTMRRSFSGPATGAGAGMAWTGEEVGEGDLKIVESLPGRGIRYDLRLEQDGFAARGAIDLEPVRDGVLVTWSTEGELGMNPWLRLMGPWIERAVGSDFDSGLAGLKRAAEGKRI